MVDCVSSRTTSAAAQQVGEQPGREGSEVPGINCLIFSSQPQYPNEAAGVL